MNKIIYIIIIIILSGVCGYLIFRPDAYYEKLADEYKRERDRYLEVSVSSIKKADSLQSIVFNIDKEIDSLKKLSKQYDLKLTAIKKYYEKKYTDVSNNTPTESYLLFTDYTNRRFAVPD